MVQKKQVLRLAAVGDLHVNKSSAGELRSMFMQAAQAADVLLLCGDLTDYGTPEEAHILAEELAPARLPTVAVLGNHDVESGKADQVVKILSDAGVHVLDGEACVIHDVGFAGVKGFAGGFGRRALGPWGEGVIKQFVNEALSEALKLESALAKLRTTQRVAVMHYSPIQATVEGEPLEIYAFLGSSRLEDPLIRYPVSAVFHGHAHRGATDGRTVNNLPVYNVAKPLLQRTWPERPPFRVVEIPKSEPAQL